MTPSSPLRMSIAAFIRKRPRASVSFELISAPPRTRRGVHDAAISRCDPISGADGPIRRSDAQATLHRCDSNAPAAFPDLVLQAVARCMLRGGASCGASAGFLFGGGSATIRGMQIERNEIRCFHAVVEA